MPAHLVGDMAYVEVLLHGWELARGTGQVLEVPAAAADQAREVLGRIGEQGRSLGAFGSLVEVPADAPSLDHALAQAGRDPRWSA